MKQFAADRICKSSGVLETGGDPVDREQQRARQHGVLGCCATLAGEQRYLQIAQRVDIDVTHGERSLERAVRIQQARLAGDTQHLGDAQVEFIADVIVDAVKRRPALRPRPVA